jgi:homoserine O-acetyltransferase
LTITTRSVEFNEPLYLESGRVLDSYKLKYETYGKLNHDKSNVVLVCHALTGSHHVAGKYEGDRKAGWWDGLIGENKAIDTNKFYVICINNIGSCFGSTGPMSINPSTKKPYRLKFPVLTITDIVKAQRRVLKHLEIESLHAVIGGSMGGMQALCYAVEHPNFAKNIIMLATTAYTRPWAIAFNKIAVDAIRNDEKFDNGNYDPNQLGEDGITGLAYGRMAGHISFLSHDSMMKKFGRRYVSQDGLYELFGRFEVERYLEYNGYNFPKNFDPLSYLYIVKTMNIFDAARNKDTLAQSLAKIQDKIYLFSFSGDLLFRPEEMKEIYDTMVSNNQSSIVEYSEIQSDYGHDAFLVELDKFDSKITKILEG